MENDTKSISVDMAEALCDNKGDGYHLLAINSHEEQQIVEDIFNKVADFYHKEALYIFLSLKMQVVILMYNNVLFHSK